MNKFKFLTVSGLAAGAASVNAEVPAEVSTAMGTLGTDIGTVGGLLIVAAVTAMTFRWLKAMFF